MAELAEQHKPRRKVPRLLNLALRTVSGFLGGCIGVAGGIFVVSACGPLPDAVTIPAVMCAFIAGTMLAFIGVGRVLGPLDSDDAREPLSPETAPIFEAALAALNQPAAAPGGAHFWPLLLGSLAIFVATGGMSRGVTGLALLSAVLVLHEAGHLLAMRAFGYRDTRILFIPFLGAVTTGQQQDIPGGQRALVLLAGPMPGLVLGFLLAASGATHTPLMRHAAGLLIGINAFNLLPLSVLDGGKLFDVLLFSRNPWLHAGFTVITSTLLGLVAYKHHAWALLAVAGLGAGSAQRSLKVAQAVRGLREQVAFPPSLVGASPEFLGALFEAAYVEVLPPALKRAGRAGTLGKACAAAMREIHAQAVQRTASLPVTVAILSGYVALFAVCASIWLRRH